MQRRDFVRTALFGTGAACSLALPGACAALGRNTDTGLSATLARLEKSGERRSWRALDQCAGTSCTVPKRVRFSVDAIGFPSGSDAIVIDAMFATEQGLRPYRIAGYQPDSLSPVSKPFSFEVDSATLAGFRAERSGAMSGATVIASSALLSNVRPVLAEGRYLLALATRDQPIHFDAIAVPGQTTDALLDQAGRSGDFAWMTFSVHPLNG